MCVSWSEKLIKYEQRENNPGENVELIRVNRELTSYLFMLIVHVVRCTYLPEVTVDRLGKGSKIGKDTQPVTDRYLDKETDGRLS